MKLVFSSDRRKVCFAICVISELPPDSEFLKSVSLTSDKELYYKKKFNNLQDALILILTTTTFRTLIWKIRIFIGINFNTGIFKSLY
jgi:hypothetical protein